MFIINTKERTVQCLEDMSIQEIKDGLEILNTEFLSYTIKPKVVFQEKIVRVEKDSPFPLGIQRPMYVVPTLQPLVYKTFIH